MMTSPSTITGPVAAPRVRLIRGLAAGAACTTLMAAAAGCGSSSTGGNTQTTRARRAATRFLTAYARPDGRVVRTDQGGDTVSEGQAYGMLLAEAAGDRAALNPAPAVLPLVASAAAASTAGDGAAARRLLQRAADQQQTHPTYYGGAWAALGPALLSRGTLGTC